MQVTNDLDFKKYVHEYCDVDSEGHDTAEDDSSYFSDDDIPSDENKEVDDDYFNMHLMDSSTLPDNDYDNAKKEMDRPQDSLELDLDSSVTVSDVFAQPNDNCVDHTKSQSDVITVDEGAPTNAEVNNNSDNEEAVDVFDRTKSQSDVITVDEGAPTTAEVNNNSDNRKQLMCGMSPGLGMPR
jgi:hypothetical protein